jgi:hypothetical protein
MESPAEPALNFEIIPVTIYQVVEPAAESVHTERRSSQITKQKLIMINVLAAEDVLQSVQRMQFQQIMRTLLQC